MNTRHFRHYCLSVFAVLRQSEVLSLARACTPGRTHTRTIVPALMWQQYS